MLEPDNSNPMFTPIGEAEENDHLSYLQAALDNPTPESRGAALIDTFFSVGPRIFFTLQHHADKEDSPYHHFAEWGLYTYDKWLGGAQATERADESEYRARSAITLRQWGIKGIGHLVARSILALPQDNPLRDMRLAFQALLEHVEYCEERHDVDGLVQTIVDLMVTEMVIPEVMTYLIEQGEALLEEVSDPQIRHTFRRNAALTYLEQARAAYQADNTALRMQLIEKAHTILGAQVPLNGELSEDEAKNLYLAGAILFEGERAEQAADTFAAVIEANALSAKLQDEAARLEGHLRLNLGHYERAIAVLSPHLPRMQERYLTEVDNETIHTEGVSLAYAVGDLAFAYAYKERWAEAVQTIDLSKSLRLRYRAALRASEAGKRLLELERRIDDLERGVEPSRAQESRGTEKVAEVAEAVGWTNDMLSPHAQLREEYRTLRPKLSLELLASPTVEEISATLGADEATVVFGLNFTGLMMAVILPGDTHQPGGHFVLKDWKRERMKQALKGENNDGWVYALGKREEEMDIRGALDGLLVELDEAVGKPLQQFLASHNVRRVTLIPHLFLHLIPFWALPSLNQFTILIVPSAAHMVHSRRRQLKARASTKALVVVNPTGDLPLSPAEADSLKHHLALSDWVVDDLLFRQATQRAVIDGIEEADWLHFCGHGRSDLFRPTRSSLLLFPDAPDILKPDTDPFLDATRRAGEWKPVTEYEVYADLPDGKRIYEKKNELTRDLDCRLLEYGSGGTLWGRYRGGQLDMVAELWTAGDIMGQPALKECSVAFLAACETGSGQLETERDEYSGLPSALQLAGVRTVICTLWPVSDRLTALYVDLFYSILAAAIRDAADAGERKVDLAELIAHVNETLRSMKKKEVAARLSTIKHRTRDRMAVRILDRWIDDILAGDESPFTHPYDWASFYTAGAGDFVF